MPDPGAVAMPDPGAVAELDSIGAYSPV